MLFSNPLFRLVVLVGLSLLFRAVCRGRVRDAITPWAFGYLMIHFELMPFTTGQLHFVLMCAYWVSAAFVMNGFQMLLFSRNGVAASMLCMWVYRMIASTFGGEVYYGLVYYANIFVELVFIGYMAGIWVLTHENGLKRLLMPSLILFPLVFLTYRKYGFVTGDLDVSGRASLDAEKLDEDTGMNVNMIGILMASYLSMLLVLLMTFLRNSGRKMVAMLTCVAALLTSYLLIRTGSRNANLVLLPSLWFLVFGFRIKNGKTKKLLVSFALLMSIALLVKVTFSNAGANAVRAFLYTGPNMSTDINSISSGRIGEFQLLVSRMSDLGHLFGMGLETIQVNGRKSEVSGGLSVYVTHYYQTGIIGCILMLVYFLKMVRYGLTHGNRGKVALFLFGVWAITGVGESVGIGRGCTIHLIWGMSLAFCTKRSFRIGETFGDVVKRPVLYYPPRGFMS